MSLAEKGGNFPQPDFGGAMEEGVGVGGVLNKYSESYAEGGLPLGWQWLGFSFHVRKCVGN